MESIVMFDIKELAKEVGFRKMLREISAYEDLDEKVEAELAKIELMEEDRKKLPFPTEKLCSAAGKSL